jgi:hypothetical protein
MSSIDPSKIYGIVNAPVTSQDATSPEAILAREARKIQVQAEVDTQYDPIVERYRNFEQPSNLTLSIPLMGVAVALSLLGLSVLMRGLIH